MFKRACIVLGVISASACAGCASPLNPSGTQNTAALHLSLDAPTCQGVVGPVGVAIDGINVATLLPGDDGVTKSVGVGTHAVSARSNDQRFVWSPTEVTVAKPSFTFLFYCKIG
jgi:hypothetical protein